VVSSKIQNLSAAVILAVWIASFFLPALANEPKNVPGHWAAFLSGYALFIAIGSLFTHDQVDRLTMLYLGSFWLANLFMIAAPFALRFARRVGALAFISLMGFWDLLTCSYLIYGRITKNMNMVRFGWWTWECSLIGMTALLFVVRRAALPGAAAPN
jgi:hypothetical protein